MKKFFLFARAAIYRALYRLNRKKSLQYLLELASVYEQLGLYFRAARIYYRTIRDHPKDPRGYYGVAILHDNRKRYTKAIHWYQKALEANPEFVPAWFFMANAVYEKGDKQKSIECYLKVISLDPTNFWACNNVGSVYEELNRNTEALRYFRKALEIMPGQHKALFNIGVVLSKMGYEQKAQEYYWESIRGYNRYPYSFLNLSLLYKNEEKLDRAIVVISEGIRCNPNASFLYYNRACYLAISGNTDDAFVDVVRAAKLNPTYISYVEKDEDLENVRKLPGYEALKRLLRQEHKDE
ncbi:MAG: tetratricopeptide repeat protein [Ruminiclostridium sp.]|jgi:tetratricopeptide (TPR) repeat protein|nr:tetratricopeptide repeat protein [Ruminiclostridium sp.]